MRILLLLATVLTSSTVTAAERPNILYIMSDDHAAHAISAYRSRLAEIAPTPNIDRLAREGALFSN
ncbi:MAG TPA: sulfatase-like hydrolase/transferase, partial [Pirellulaceae bacterium]|nr:sulfatase-like hydrolase/transferase [Pirellulaceae bacterium]